MSAGKKELLCSRCRKRVSYQILKRPAKALIKNFEIKYDELYGICEECGTQIYVPGLEDQNEERIEEIYRKKKELISISEIKAVLEKYHIDKRPLSKLLGFGELTITRYMDGQLPSKKYSDILYGILNDEQKMKAIVEKNSNLVSNVTINKVNRAIEQCEKEKKIDNSAEKAALYIIGSGKGITNLLLQKILYYVKSISAIFNGVSIISEPCEAWKFGPVFPTVYEKYKEFGKMEITLNLSESYIMELYSEEERKIIDYVLNTFGIYNVWFLKDLTHMEDPWICARNGIDENDSSRNVMDDQLIKEYFKKVNERYNLTTPDGVNAYVNDMKKRMHM